MHEWSDLWSKRYLVETIHPLWNGPWYKWYNDESICDLNETCSKRSMAEAIHGWNDPPGFVSTRCQFGHCSFQHGAASSGNRFEQVSFRFWVASCKGILNHATLHPVIVSTRARFIQGSFQQGVVSNMDHFSQLSCQPCFVSTKDRFIQVSFRSGVGSTRVRF